MNARTLLLASTPLVAQLAACTCSETPMITGEVVDLWGNPVEGMQVAIKEIEPSFTTARNGTFALPMMPTATVTLTRDGYLPRTVTLEPPDLQAPFQQTIEVIPKPESPGYYIVGEAGFLPLAAEPVVRTGTDLQTWQGIRSSGDVSAKAGDLRVLFHTPLKLDQVARLDIELHKLAFIEETQVGTVDGAASVNVNLWVSDGKIPVAREALSGDDFYLYKADGLAAGTYAFSSLQLLDAKNPGAYDKAPPQVRKIHPFTLE